MLLCGVVFKFFKWILRIAFGRVIKPEDYMKDVFGDYKREDMKFDETKTINLFGYKASINVIITFSIIVFTAYTIGYFFKYKSPYLSGIVSNPLLSLVVVLLLLWVLEYVVPTLIFKFINFVLNVRFKLLFMKFK